MEGENQVECHEAANAKFDALRRDWLAELPELLIAPFEAMGIHYQTFLMKKRTTTFTKFPMELDVAEYTHSGSHKQRGSTIYILSGILIHRGPAGVAFIIQSSKIGKLVNGTSLMMKVSRNSTLMIFPKRISEKTMETKAHICYSMTFSPLSATKCLLYLL